jgi:hypothetical protein
MSEYFVPRSGQFDQFTLLQNGVPGSYALFEDQMNYANRAEFEANWQFFSDGQGEVTFDADGLVAGNNSGNDEIWYYFKQNIPFIKDILYKISVKTKGNTAGVSYCGFNGVAADGISFINVNGNDSAGSQHYFAQLASNISAEWQVHSGYCKGNGLPAGGRRPDQNNPGKMYPGVAYIRPMFICNYNNQPGVTYVDYIKIEAISKNIYKAWKLYIDGADYTDKIFAGSLNVKLTYSPLSNTGGVTLFDASKTIASGQFRDSLAEVYATIGGGEFIKVFTGKSSGANLSLRSQYNLASLSFTDKHNRINMADIKIAPYIAENVPLIDKNNPGSSHLHFNAAALGLPDADIVADDVTTAGAPVLLFEDGDAAWSNIRQIAKQAYGVPFFNNEGKLQIITPFGDNWTPQGSEFEISQDSGMLLKTPASDTQIFQPHVFTTSNTRYDLIDFEGSATGVIFDKSIKEDDPVVINAGEWWDGKGSVGVETVVQMRYGIPPNSASVFCISPIKPTIGQATSFIGYDIEIGAGSLLIDSFNGLDSVAAPDIRTRQLGDISEIILKNDTASPVTIKKITMRGTNVYQAADNPFVRTNINVPENERVIFDMPGKFFIGEAQRTSLAEKWLDFGKVPRTPWKIASWWLPQAQPGAYVTLVVPGQGAKICRIAEINHAPIGNGGMIQQKTLLTLIEIQDAGAASASGVTKSISDTPQTSTDGAVWNKNIVDQPLPSAAYAERFEYENMSKLLENWEIAFGNTPGLQLVNDGVSGGKFLRIGDNDGVNDAAYFISKQTFPYPPEKIAITVRVRQFGGTSIFYAGFAGIDKDGNYVNIAGIDSLTSQHYIAAAGDAGPLSFTEYTGYAQGTDAAGSGKSPNENDPGKAHVNVVAFKLIFLANWNSPAFTGTFDIDMIAFSPLQSGISPSDSLPVSINDGPHVYNDEIAVIESGIKKIRLEKTGRMYAGDGGTNLGVDIFFERAASGGVTISNGYLVLQSGSNFIILDPVSMELYVGDGNLTPGNGKFLRYTPGGGLQISNGSLLLKSGANRIELDPATMDFYVGTGGTVLGVDKYLYRNGATGDLSLIGGSLITANGLIKIDADEGYIDQERPLQDPPQIGDLRIQIQEAKIKFQRWEDVDPEAPGDQLDWRADATFSNASPQSFELSIYKSRWLLLVSEDGGVTPGSIVFLPPGISLGTAINTIGKVYSDKVYFTDGVYWNDNPFFHLILDANKLYANINIPDTRGDNQPPTYYNREMAVDFKLNATIGVPGSGNFSGLLTIAPWSDNSGDAHHQLALNEAGIFWRQGQPDASAWDEWDEIQTTKRRHKNMLGLSGNYTDLDTSGAVIIRASGPAIIKGILPRESVTVKFINVGDFSISFDHEDSAATPNNRLINSNGARVHLAVNASTSYWYDPEDNRWREN